MKTIIIVSAMLMALITVRDRHLTNETNNQSSYKLELVQPLYIAESFNKKISTANDEIDQSWYDKAVEQIQSEEYHISYSEDLKAFQSPNRSNNLRFSYHKTGFTVKQRSERIPLFNVSDNSLSEDQKKYETITPWEITFDLEDINRSTNNSSLKKSEEKISFNTELNISDNTAFIENENIRINYKNEPEGMRQDFILKTKPKNNGLIQLEFSVDTKLNMSVTKEALSFKDKIGNEKLMYSSLKVFDATGKKLEAYFEEGKEKNSYIIAVNDDDAEYPVTVDPLSYSPHWTAEGNQVGARFGTAVSSAGNVNGDAYSDVIIGAPFYDNGLVDEGAVFVYYGSATGLSTFAGWQDEINVAGAQYGCAVSSTGDYNNDGYDDVVAGAKNYSNGQTNEGAVVMSFGGASGMTTAGFLHQSNVDNAFLGCSVSPAGRVNGDVYDDFIAGAEGFTNGQTGEGRAYVFLGIITHMGGFWTAEINQANAAFGCSVAAGDINGDGYSDIVVGAQEYANGENDEGAAFVWYGSVTGLGAPGNETNFDWLAESNQGIVQGGRLGNCVGVTNVNGDAYGDIMISSRFYNNSSGKEGALFVYYGSSGGAGPFGTPANADWSAFSGQDSCAFGYSLSSDDFNNDGFKDILLGAYFYDNTLNNEGAAFVWYGSATGPGATGSPSNADWKVFGQQANANFGISVSSAGDINNDTYADVIIGASLYDNGESNEGRAFLYMGSNTGLALIPYWNVEAQQTGAEFGFSISTAGFINNDIYSDVIVGAPFYDNGNADEGAVFVYHGSSSGLLTGYNWKAEIDLDSAQFGSEVATAGDVNGDGYSDVIIGAKRFSNGQNNEGKVFVWYGDINGLGTNGTSANADWSYESNTGGALLGHAVGSAGDVNGDGFSDVIVAANNFSNGQSNEGRVFVFYGSPAGLSSVPAWTAESNQASALFGSSCSSAGDVNGDKFSDILVGANLYDNGNTNEGAMFLWLGSPSGLGDPGTPANADWIAETDQDNARMGTSVRSAGDVNGDGYSDVITGARLYDKSFTDEGAAFLWYGSASGMGTNGIPSNADWSAYGGQPGASFGYSCSSAGDANVDGYSDIVIGAYGYSGMIPNEGAAFIWLGSSSGLNTGGSPATAIWSAFGGQTGCEFGYSVAFSNDVNGDGGSEVLVGSHYYDNVETDEGKTSIFYLGGQGAGNKDIAITFFLQGFYSSVSNLMISDNVKIYVRNYSAPFNKLDSATFTTSTNGINFTTVNSPSLVNNTNYYLQIVHRNSLDTWTKAAKFIGNTMNYNMTTSNTQAFGNNQSQIDASPVNFGIYGGDAVRNGIIDLNDIIFVYNAASVFTTGYVNSDVTGDNLVNLNDITLAYNNAAGFVSSIAP